MPGRGRRRQVERPQWRQFLAVAENFAQAARKAALKLRDEMNTYREMYF